MEEITFTQLSVSELRQIIQEELSKFFSQYESISKQTSEQKVVDLNGLLKARPFIGSRSTVYKKVSSGLIPHSKSGKRLIFDLRLVDEWLLSNKVKTVKEIEKEAEIYLSKRSSRKS